MENENMENLDAEVQEEQVDAVEPQEVDEKDWKKIAQDQKIRAEKAEKALKAKSEEKPEVKEVEHNHTGLSPKDYLALTENGVKADEYDRVLELATLLKKPVFETLKDKTAQAILKSEREERATANATAVSAKARKSGKSSKEIVLDNLASGKLPETEEEQKSLAEAQFEQLLNKGK